MVTKRSSMPVPFAVLPPGTRTQYRDIPLASRSRATSAAMAGGSQAESPASTLGAATTSGTVTVTPTPTCTRSSSDVLRPRRDARLPRAPTCEPTGEDLAAFTPDVSRAARPLDIALGIATAIMRPESQPAESEGRNLLACHGLIFSLYCLLIFLFSVLQQTRQHYPIFVLCNRYLFLMILILPRCQHFPNLADSHFELVFTKVRQFRCLLFYTLFQLDVEIVIAKWCFSLRRV